jgi:glutathione S-transferase
MKLYYSKGACSLGVRITIHEIGIACDYEAVNLKTKQTEKGADYLKINPKGAVPALQLDDNTILTENAAIQIYLAEKFNTPQLLPAIGNVKRYRVLEWLSFISSDLHKAFSPLFNPNVPEELKQQIFIPILKSKLDLLNNHLSHNNYLVSDQFTIADSYLFVILTWLHHFKLELTNWEHLHGYATLLRQRKSVQEALKEEK